MRPVNLIPPEERPGERRPMRGGPLAYIVVGALAAAVIGVAVLAVTDNQISDSKTEIVKLEDEKAAVEARAQALDAYTQFHTLREQRVATIASLADSRFDWQRVMHEFALVLPSDVWLTSLSGSASPQSTAEGTSSGIHSARVGRELDELLQPPDHLDSCRRSPRTRVLDDGSRAQARRSRRTRRSGRTTTSFARGSRKQSLRSGGGEACLPR